MRVVKDDALMRRRPADFDAREIFVVAEEIIEAFEWIGRIAICICDARDHVHVVGQH